MTRVLVLSNSHGTALRLAKSDFAALFPDVQLDFFGVTGPMLKEGKSDESGTFTPFKLARRRMNIVNTIDDQDQINLKGFDHVLVIGFQTSPVYIGKAFRGFQLMPEKTRSAKKIDPPSDQLMSRALALEILGNYFSDWSADLKKRFPGLDNLVFTPTPAPAETIGARANYQLAKDFIQFNSHPNAAEIAQISRNLAKKAANDAGFGFVEQPEVTMAAPYGTKSEYAARSFDRRGNDLGIKDHRHMNQAYGLEVLRAFAQQHLGLASQAA